MKWCTQPVGTSMSRSSSGSLGMPRGCCDDWGVGITEARDRCVPGCDMFPLHPSFFGDRHDLLHIAAISPSPVHHNAGRSPP